MENNPIFSKNDFINHIPVSMGAFGVLSRVQHKKFPEKFFLIKYFMANKNSDRIAIENEIEILQKLENLEKKN